MPDIEPVGPHTLLDREIMLRCLADAAERAEAVDFAPGRPGRRLLELRLRTTAARRDAALVRDQARAMRGAPDAPLSAGARRRAILSAISMGRMQMDMRRADLWMERTAAAETRSDARALRAQARQVRHHAGRPPD